MAKWTEICAGFLWVLFFPTIFVVVVWRIDRNGRRKGYAALRRWTQFTFASAITFCAALAILVVPGKLRVGIPITSTFVGAIVYGAGMSWYVAYYLSALATGAGIIGSLVTAVIITVNRRAVRRRLGL